MDDDTPDRDDPAGSPAVDDSPAPAESDGANDDVDSEVSPPADGCESRGNAPGSDGLTSVVVEEIGGADGVTVSAALYPLADTEGNPWSQWGQGVVLSDGRFVSAVGDHLGVDGTSWLYEYLPESGELVRTVEVSGPLGHEAGDWGYGKVHAPMVLSACGDVIAATYWGTRRDLVLGDSYQGDQLFRYDPWTREIDALGVPVTGFGIPSMAISPDRRWIFGEAVDPESDPDAGVFFVADADSGEVVHVDDSTEHSGFRSIMVTPDGRGHYTTATGDLVAVDPASGDTEVLEDVLPGDWLRAATAIGPDGTVYGTTRDPDWLFGLTRDGDVIDLGELEDYVASLALSPDGETLYYVPGAHGDGVEFGTPLIAVDLESGERTELVRLNDLIEPELGVRAGGTYNIVADPSGSRLYIGLNAGPIDDDEDAFGDVVLVVVDLE